MNYTIYYDITTDGGVFVSGTVRASNAHMTRQIALQYAAKHLWDTTDVGPNDIDVNDIQVSWR